MSTYLNDRMLYVESVYGVADADRGIARWTNDRGEQWVAAVWYAPGQGDVHAVVPASDVTVGEVWSCTQDMGLNTGCLDDATQHRDGFALCDRHAEVHDMLVRMERDL
jgi:hypothetical protein